MFNTIISAVTAYLSTNLDYLGFLVAFFAQSKAPRKYRYILFGNVIGVIILVSCSLILGLILHTIPSEWILGLLGIIPLYFGCRLLFSNDDDDQDIQTGLTGFKLSSYVALLTVTSCSADNLGIYTPLFAAMTTPKAVYATLLTFALMLIIVFLFALVLTHLPVIAGILEKHGNQISALIYLGLGGYLLYECGTLTHLLAYFY
ncbi:cadmium resistance transporter [Limosilactobacillus mucosae]|uniref:cadmium resistance transporter n=1 Tax=Limosilactobacillus mucosae TaxID=97478 RepID=UPI00233EE900|nr:cadmium resistance transporter [Limosilactobacillus mucosae]MDC2839885.1 cadmium resistance transporter [Limosilactobacillus mucosae]